MQGILTIISFLAVSQLSNVTSLPTNNNSKLKDFQGPPHSATVLQLSRRGSLTDEKTGLLDQKTLDAHLRYVLRKQVIGAMNYYKNTGNVLSTFNMTPFQLEDMYHSGSVPLIVSDAVEVSGKEDDSEKPLSSLRAVSQSDIPVTQSKPPARGTTMPLDNLGEKDLIWAATVHVGNPPKAFLVSVDTLSQSKATPFFTALTKASGQQGVMGSRFSRKSDVGSEITIGGVNPAAFVGPFTTLNVMAMEGQPPAFWDVSLDGAIVNGQRLKLSSAIATIDTGTSVIGVPQDDARAIYASVPGALPSGGGQYTFPCASMPFVSMVFGGRRFDINPADMSILIEP
ncbi:hypothetical protein PtA15_2A660 [Puccinia triticina]|uniref:Peptidase A1 domain-containing protein n=1 Tax=Puccinia triticina TaxID=208348 RepID=A0ABY7CAY0_9BASI|nr:uncharacterized protein PtA15_2A660 [Puccinia triticina]WAQ82343.1 hypothetical protein PtA15_2A660 [Puccinia triticina]